MFRKKILAKYLGEENIVYIIAHHWWVYVKLILFYTFFLLIWFVWYRYLSYVFDWRWLSYIFWIYWIVVYIKFVIDFMDIYLDSIVLTPQGVNIFLWEWIFKYSNEAIERNAIESVYDEQNWLLDMLLEKWNIIIKRIDEEYRFEDVPKPAMMSNIIIEMKERFTSADQGDNTQNEEKDKFELLVEVLWEVIKEYLNNKKFT